MNMAAAAALRVKKAKLTFSTITVQPLHAQTLVAFPWTIRQTPASRPPIWRSSDRLRA